MRILIFYIVWALVPGHIANLAWGDDTTETEEEVLRKVVERLIYDFDKLDEQQQQNLTSCYKVWKDLNCSESNPERESVIAKLKKFYETRLINSKKNYYELVAMMNSHSSSCFQKELSPTRLCTEYNSLGKRYKRNIEVKGDPNDPDADYSFGGAIHGQKVKLAKTKGRANLEIKHSVKVKGKEVESTVAELIDDDKDQWPDRVIIYGEKKKDGSVENDIEIFLNGTYARSQFPDLFIKGQMPSKAERCANSKWDPINLVEYLTKRKKGITWFPSTVSSYNRGMSNFARHDRTPRLEKMYQSDAIDRNLTPAAYLTLVKKKATKGGKVDVPLPICSKEGETDCIPAPKTATTEVTVKPTATPEATPKPQAPEFKIKLTQQDQNGNTALVKLDYSESNPSAKMLLEGSKTIVWTCSPNLCGGSTEGKESVVVTWPTDETKGDISVEVTAKVTPKDNKTIDASINLTMTKPAPEYSLSIGHDEEEENHTFSAELSLNDKKITDIAKEGTLEWSCDPSSKCSGSGKEVKIKHAKASSDGVKVSLTFTPNDGTAPISDTAFIDGCDIVLDRDCTEGGSEEDQEEDSGPDYYFGEYKAGQPMGPIQYIPQYWQKGPWFMHVGGF